MEWDLITSGHKFSFCPDIDAVTHLLVSHGYSALSLSPLGLVDEECMQMQKGLKDMLWMHKDAKPLWDGDLGYRECV